MNDGLYIKRDIDAMLFSVIMRGIIKFGYIPYIKGDRQRKSRKLRRFALQIANSIKNKYDKR